MKNNKNLYIGHDLCLLKGAIINLEMANNNFLESSFYRKKLETLVTRIKDSDYQIDSIQKMKLKKVLSLEILAAENLLFYQA